MNHKYVMPPVDFDLVDARNIVVDFCIQTDRSMAIEFTGITVCKDTHEHYKGEYSVTPRTHTQTLATGNMVCDEDIIIDTIPISKVSNPKGGFTAIIG